MLLGVGAAALAHVGPTLLCLHRTRVTWQKRSERERGEKNKDRGARDAVSSMERESLQVDELKINLEPFWKTLSANRSLQNMLQA